MSVWTDEPSFLRAMAARYVWDRTGAEAAAEPDRTIRRVMDLGTIEDVLAMEAVLDHDKLAAVLRASPAGSMRPRSWWFWHNRLALTDVTQDPPPMPVRAIPR